MSTLKNEVIPFWNMSISIIAIRHEHPTRINDSARHLTMIEIEDEPSRVLVATSFILNLEKANVSDI